MSVTLKATTVMMSETQRSFVSRFMEEGIFSHFNSEREIDKLLIALKELALFSDDF